jgi:hypothetical protein
MDEKMNRASERSKKNKQIQNYDYAVKEFAKSTIHNPDFFKLSREEQKEEAMKFLKKHQHEQKEK